MNTTAETFTLDLGDGTRCRAVIDYNGIETLAPDELPKRVRMDCEGAWTKSHFDRYVRWIAELWQRIANRSNKPFCSRLYWPAGESVLIVCEPGLRPELHSSLQLSLF